MKINNTNKKVNKNFFLSNKNKKLKKIKKLPIAVLSPLIKLRKSNHYYNNIILIIFLFFN